MEPTEEAKQKLLSVWHNVKYSKLAQSTTASDVSKNDEDVVLLGNVYAFPDQRLEFQEDFRSKIWLTYRRRLRRFEGTAIDSDCGWGCTIRSAQMLLANALMLHHCGRRWRWRPKHLDGTHRRVVDLFTETRANAPCAIHRLVAIAEESVGRKPGDWFGPATTAHVLKEAVDMSASKEPLLRNLRIYVAKDCTVYKADVKVAEKSAVGDNLESFSMVEAPSDYPSGLIPAETTNSTSGRLFSGIVDGVPYFEEAREVREEEFYALNRRISVDGQSWIAEDYHRQEASFTSSQEASFKPVLVLIPIRLGAEKINPIYVATLRSLLASENCVGVIGGRPKHSLYLLGFQGADDVIFLDPHLVQDGDVFRLESFHSQDQAKKVSALKLDPSCCVGFYCPTEENFDAWCEMMRTMAEEFAPLFSIVDGTRDDEVSRRSNEDRVIIKDDFVIL